MQDTNSINSFFKNITKPSSIDSYTPKNNKLLTGEFNYLVASNNNGVSNTFYYETFTGTTCNFVILGIPVFRCFNYNDTNKLRK